MQKIMKILKSHTVYVFLMMCIAALASFLSIWTATVTKCAVDYAVSGNKTGCFAAIGIIFFVTIFIIVMKIVYQINSEKIKTRIEIELKSRALHDFMRSDYAKANKLSDGEVITRLSSDVKTVSETAVLLPATVCSIAAKLVGVLYVLSAVSLIFVIALPVLLILIAAVSLVFKNKLKKLYKEQQQKDGRVLNLLREVLKNIPVIKAFAMYDGIDNKAEILQQDYYKARMKRKIFSVISGTGMSVGFEMCNLAAVGLCLSGILTKALSAGSITAVVQIFVQMKAPISSLTSLLPAYYSMTAALDRIDELSKLCDNAEEQENNAEYICAKSIVFENVSFKYDGEWILKNFSCEIPFGKITVIEGESGRGKSTLLKLMLGLYKPDSGKIYINTATEKIKLNRSSGMFSYVPQDAQLFSESIRDNLRLANNCAEEKDIQDALKKGGIYSFIRELPKGIDYVLGEDGHNLSEGQFQRLAIARAFVSNAPVMLMDEPTSALDEITEKLLVDSIDKNRDRTYIIVSHKKEIERICDKIIRM